MPLFTLQAIAELYRCLTNSSLIAEGQHLLFDFCYLYLSVSLDEVMKEEVEVASDHIGKASGNLDIAIEFIVYWHCCING